MPKKHIPLDRLSPIKATEKKFHSPKVRIFLWLSVISYGLMFYTLFWQFLVLKSMLFVMLFFLFFHFFYLQVRKLPIKYFLVLMLSLTILQWIFISYDNLWILWSIVAINMGIVYFARFLQWESHEKIYFSSQWYFNVGGYMFTVFITIAYSMFVIWYYQSFPFTCQWLSQASNSVIDYISKPFKLGIEEAKTMKENTELFFKSKVIDLKKIEIQNWEKTPTFIDKLSEYKKSRLDQTIADNTKVNMGICDYVLGEINTIYNVPWFKVSVLALMFLLLYGFIRIEFWIMTGIALILFKILYALNVYRTKKVMKEVEELE